MTWAANLWHTPGTGYVDLDSTCVCHGSDYWCAMIELQGGLALITGASRGIGEKLAHAFAERGMRLLLTARSATDLEAVAARLRAKQVDVHTVAMDVTDRRAREELVQLAETQLGGVRLLVNNAGVEKIGKYEALTEDDVEHIVNVNLLAPMHLTRLVLVGMQGRRSGHVLNMASMAGLFGAAHAETYTATKHGLVGFTRSLRASAFEDNTGVSASVVCPGFVDDVGMYNLMRKNHGAKTSSLFHQVLSGLRHGGHALLRTCSVCQEEWPPSKVPTVCARSVEKTLTDAPAPPSWRSVPWFTRAGADGLSALWLLDRYSQGPG